MSTHQATPPVDSLVLYKVHPARVISVGEKIEIELDGGQTKRVRPKDVELLHPGPLKRLADLAPQSGDFEEAWELLEGSTTNLRELAELAFPEFTPASAWATWQQVSEGLRFTGTPTAIEVRTRDLVENERAERAAKAAAEQEWNEFLERMKAACPGPEDAERLAEIERLAHARSEHSRTLAALGYTQTPENAHRALIQVGYWSANHNPYPARAGAPVVDADLPVPPLPEEERVDLTHLAAFAIDDEGNEDPDDAISLDGDRFWVHIADVSALVTPQSDMDREARSRGANLYLPEGIVKMLPAPVTEQLGLGLQEISPALSFGMVCDENGELHDLEVVRSWVRVTRLSYAEVDRQLDRDPFAPMQSLAQRYHARRQANGATRLALPEVSVRVEPDGQVLIRPLPRLESRELVTNAMLMGGEVAARICHEHGIAIPFATQVPPEPGEEGADLASMYARRRCFKPTRLASEPDLHAGLGLPIYTRATSPLRRYADLLVHQQLRAWLRGESLLSREEIIERMGEGDSASVAIRRGERMSNQHWKLVYLRDHPQWRGEAVVVGREERKAVLLIPSLALETRVRTREPLELNARIQIAVTDVELPELSVNFRILG